MDLVIIQTFDNYFRANIQLTRLRAAGIECYLKDEYVVTIDPFLSNAIGGIKLMVRKSEEHKVRKLLREMNAEADSKLLCPECGSHKFILVPKRSAENLLAAISPASTCTIEEIIIPAIIQSTPNSRPVVLYFCSIGLFFIRMPVTPKIISPRIISTIRESLESLL